MLGSKFLLKLHLESFITYLCAHIHFVQDQTLNFHFCCEIRNQLGIHVVLLRSICEYLCYNRNVALTFVRDLAHKWLILCKMSTKDRQTISMGAFINKIMKKNTTSL